MGRPACAVRSEPRRRKPDRVPEQPASAAKLLAHHQSGPASSPLSLGANLHAYLLDSRRVKEENEKNRRRTYAESSHRISKKSGQAAGLARRGFASKAAP